MQIKLNSCSRLQNKLPPELQKLCYCFQQLHWLILFTHPSIHPSIHSSLPSFLCSFVHSHVCSLVRSLICWLACLFVCFCLFVCLFVCSLFLYFQMNCMRISSLLVVLLMSLTVSLVKGNCAKCCLGEWKACMTICNEYEECLACNSEVQACQIGCPETCQEIKVAIACQSVERFLISKALVWVNLQRKSTHPS